MERCKIISHIWTSELLVKVSLQGGLVSVDYGKKVIFDQFQFQARKKDFRSGARMRFACLKLKLIENDFYTKYKNLPDHHIAKS